MATSWKTTQPGFVGAQPITDVSTVQNHVLGTKVKAVDTGSTAYGEGEFIYCAGVASTVAGSVVVIDTVSHTTSLADADAAASSCGPVALAVSANVASRYGWYQIFGTGVAKVLTGFADNKACFLTATGGSVDDAVVDGDGITGMTAASAIGTPASGQALVNLAYPNCLDASP